MAPENLDLSPEVAARLQATKEQREVVGPLVEYLRQRGWSLDHLVFGRSEWRVPRSPSEATKREKGGTFRGWPVDIAAFDLSGDGVDPSDLQILIECKEPEESAGVGQLEVYMAREPHVPLGIWTNTADPSGPATFVYRLPDGSFARRRQLLRALPEPGDKVSPDEAPLLTSDLTIPTADVLRRVIADLLDHVVANDSQVTRREDQLEQLCNLLLLKLDSDRQAKAAPLTPPVFRPRRTASETAGAIRSAFETLVNLYPGVFREPRDKALSLADDTITHAVDRLAPYRLIDVGMSTMSLAFQLLRTAALKQGEGQYFTPAPVVQAGVRLLQVQYDDLVIDPACGTGGFLVEVLTDFQRRHPAAAAEGSRWAQTHIYGIDKDPIGVKLTKAIMQIVGDGSANCVRGDSVRTSEWPEHYPELQSGQFASGRFSVVVTNPPFGVNLKVTAEDCSRSGLSIAASKDGNYRDTEIGLVFLQRAHQLLRIGGRLGIILPETYLFSQGYEYVVRWLKPRFRPRIVLNVPMEAFQGFCRAKTNFYVFEKIANEESII